MKKSLFNYFLLLFFILTTGLFTSCDSIFSSLNKKSENGSSCIELNLPYGIQNNGPRAADTQITYEFSVLFEHEDGTDTPFKGNSGDTITFKDAPVGKYTIVATGVSNETGGTYKGVAETEVFEGQSATVSIKLTRTDKVEINILSFTEEIPDMIKYYISTHPNCGIVLKPKIFSNTNAEYSKYLSKSLAKDSSIDLYSAEAACVLRATNGDLSSYALPYKEVISNFDEKLNAAQYDSYVVQVGSNNAKEVLGLSYQLTGGAFIYRRSVAKTVFGTDDPKTISEKIGGGSEKWDNFWEAAAECKAKNVSILSGEDDLWHSMASTASKPWIVNDKLNIDENRALYYDYAKKLHDNGWTNGSENWSQNWYNDIAGKGEKPVLGFFGPAWLLNFSIVPNCDANDNDWAVCTPPISFYWGGTWLLANKSLEKASLAKQKAIGKLLEWMFLDTSENGMLYLWANGLMGNTKDTVPSKVVSTKSDGSIPVLKGQNMYDYFVTDTKTDRSAIMTQYDEEIDNSFVISARKYIKGYLTKEEAINSFKMDVLKNTGIESDFEYGVYSSAHARTEPDPDGNGVKITLFTNDGEEWPSYNGAYIYEKNSGIYLKLDDKVPTADNSVEYYFPFTKDKGRYDFECNIETKPEKWITEPIIGFAKGGLGEMTLTYDNLNVTLSGNTVKLADNFTYSFGDKGVPEGVRVIFDSYVTTTDTSPEERGPNAWDFEWKDCIGSGEVDFSDSLVELAKSSGYSVFKPSLNAQKSLEANPYYVAKITIDYKVDIKGQTWKYEASGNAYSNIASYDDSLKSAMSNSAHMKAEAVEGGIKITVSKLTGEDAWNKHNAVRQIIYTDDKYDWEYRKEGLIAEFEDNCLSQSSNNNLVLTDENPTFEFIFPFTEAGKYYEFEVSGRKDQPEEAGDYWYSESVICQAAGGKGELIDVAYWAKDVNVIFETQAYKLNCDLEKLFKNQNIEFIKSNFNSLVLDWVAKDKVNDSTVEERTNHINIAESESQVSLSDITNQLQNNTVTSSTNYYVNLNLFDIKLKDDEIKYHLPGRDFGKE